MKKINLLILSILITFVSCKNNSKKYISEITASKISEEQFNFSKGFQLLESNCFACHSPKTTIEDRIAPPIVAIKK